MNKTETTGMDITHRTFSVLFLMMLVGACAWILRPFFVSFIWAAIIVIAVWPLFARVKEVLRGRRFAAVAAVMMMILLVVLIPIVLAVASVVDAVHGLSSLGDSHEAVRLPQPPAWIERIPLAGDAVASRWKELAALEPAEQAGLVMPYASHAVQWFLARAGSIGVTMIQVLLTALMAAVLFARGDTVAAGVVAFAKRLAGPRGEEATVLAAKVAQGVFLGVVLTAVIQAFIGGIGLLIAGVPAAGPLTVLLIVLCLAQAGPLPVLMPAVAWLFWSGSTTGGVVLLCISAVAAALDNIVRPLLIRRGVDLPLIMIFTGVIGGLVAFGFIGLFIGPVILAVSFALLKAWVSGDAAEGVAGGHSDR